MPSLIFTTIKVSRGATWLRHTACVCIITCGAVVGMTGAGPGGGLARRYGRIKARLDCSGFPAEETGEGLWFGEEQLDRPVLAIAPGNTGDMQQDL
jgi:hypothetical protein